MARPFIEHFQKAAQQAAVLEVIGSHGATPKREIPAENAVSAGIAIAGMGGTGLEQIAELSRNTEGSQTRDAKSDANGARDALIDPDLSVVIDAWPKLPEAIKAGILAMIRATRDAD